VKRIFSKRGLVKCKPVRGSKSDKKKKVEGSKVKGSKL
jgi:hypothetical protein